MQRKPLLDHRYGRIAIAALLIALWLAQPAAVTAQIEEPAAPEAVASPEPSEAPAEPEAADAAPEPEATTAADGAAEAPADATGDNLDAPPADAPTTAPTMAMAAPAVPPAPTVPIDERLRGILVDLAGETYGRADDATRIVAEIKAAGFSDVFLVVARGGVAMYPSRFLPRAAAFGASLEDPVMNFIREARQADLKVHLVIHPLEAYTGTDERAIPAAHVLKRHRDWMLVDQADSGVQPEGIIGLDPALDPVHTYLTDVIRELVQRYSSADGIVLHDLRYPGILAEWGYGRPTIASFALATGESFTPSPEDPAWQNWRRERLNLLLERLVEVVREIAPAMNVATSASALGLPPVDETQWNDSAVFAGALQDWVTWGREGKVDTLLLLNYKSERFDRGFFDGWTEFAEAFSGEADLIIGIGQSENFAEEILSQIRRTLRTSAKGIMLASYQQPSMVAGSRSDIFNTLARSIFNTTYIGLRRANLVIDPAFVDQLERPEDRATPRRSRDDIEIPEEFLQPVTMPIAESTDHTNVAEQPSRPAATPGTGGATRPTATILQDMIILRGGSTIRGRITGETASSVMIRNESGFELTIDKDRILEIRRAER